MPGPCLFTVPVPLEYELTEGNSQECKAGLISLISEVRISIQILLIKVMLQPCVSY